MRAPAATRIDCQLLCPVTGRGAHNGTATRRGSRAGPIGGRHSAQVDLSWVGRAPPPPTSCRSRPALQSEQPSICLPLTWGVSRRPHARSTGLAGSMVVPAALLAEQLDAAAREVVVAIFSCEQL